MSTEMIKQHLKIVFDQLKPHLVLRNENPPYKMEGFCERLLQVLQSRLNFSYALVLSPDRTWGNQLDNGSFTGMFGMLQRNEADMILAPSVPSLERSSVSDMSIPFAMSSSNILVGVPREATAVASVQMFLGVCDPEVYLLIVVVCVTFGRASRALLKKSSDFIYFWTFIELFFLKGTRHLPETISSRVVVIFWVVTCFLLLTAYSSFVTSVFSVSPQPEFIRSLEDTPKYPHKLPLFIKGLSTARYIQVSENPLLRRCWAQTLSYPWLLSSVAEIDTDDVLNKIEKGELYLMDIMEFIRPFLENRLDRNGSCSFAVSTPFRSAMISVGFRKGLSKKFMTETNKIIRWATESESFRGAQAFTMDRYTRCLTTAKVPSTSDFTPLTIETFILHYILLLTGSIVSTVGLLGEVFHVKIVKLKKKRETLIIGRTFFKSSNAINMKMNPKFTGQKIHS